MVYAIYILGYYIIYRPEVVAATVPLNKLDLLGGERNLYARVEVALEVRLGAVLHQVALRLQHVSIQSTI
jgi:hypothetical protein